MQQTCRVFRVYLSLVCATHRVLDAGAPAANRMNRVSAVVGVTWKVMVQSKLTKVSLSSGNAKSFQIYIYIYIYFFFFNGSGAGFTLDVTEHVAHGTDSCAEKGKIKWGGRGLPLWSSGCVSICQCRGQGFHPWSGSLRAHLPQDN